MFSRIISELSPWTDQGMFDNIRCTGYRDGYGDADHSITAIARALLARRLSENEGFDIKISNIPHDEVPADMDAVLEDIARTATGGNECVNSLSNIIIFSQLYNLPAPEHIELVFKSINDQFLPNHPAWKPHAKANGFLNRELKALVLINESRNAALVVTQKLRMPQWHLLGSMLPAYTKNLFEKVPLDDVEKGVLRSLALHGSATFVNSIASLEERYDIRGKKITALVGGFEKRERAQQVNIVDNEIIQINNQMDDLMRRYQDLCDKKDQANVRRAGLKYMADNAGETDELVRFFQSNKCLDVVEVRGSRISFIVKTFYENFNPDEYEHFRENDSFFEEMLVDRGPFHEEENCRKLLDAMFIQNTIKLKLCAIYHLDIRGDVNTTCGYSYPTNCSDYVPNYHLDHHRCFGNYAAIITEYLRNADTIGAINACIASAKSVNIAESGATFNPMMREVFRSTKACFVLPDGSSVTPAKALEWLNEQEGGSQNETDHAE